MQGKGSLCAPTFPEKRGRKGQNEWRMDTYMDLHGPLMVQGLRGNVFIPVVSKEWTYERVFLSSPAPMRALADLVSNNTPHCFPLC